MKNIINVLTICFVTFISPLSFALTSSGTIDEIKVCGTGNTGNPKWLKVMVFKISGAWFGSYADYYGDTTGEYDDNLVTSIVLSAFAGNNQVEILATGTWGSDFQNCEAVNGAVIHGSLGDYIKMTK